MALSKTTLKHINTYTNNLPQRENNKYSFTFKECIFFNNPLKKTFNFQRYPTQYPSSIQFIFYFIFGFKKKTEKEVLQLLLKTSFGKYC